MSGFGKLHSSMWDGSLYGHLEASATLMALVTLCDANGIVDMTPEAISGRTGWPIEFIGKGIVELEQDDPRSRTPDNDGRRLIRLDEHRDWGWLIVNYEKYRETRDPDRQRDLTRERVRKFRLKNAGLEYGSSCAYCGSEATGPDHVLPVTQGGVTCVPACRRCNQHKSNRTLADFLNDRFCDFIDHELVRVNDILMTFVSWDGKKYSNLPEPIVIDRNACNVTATGGDAKQKQKQKQKQEDSPLANAHGAPVAEATPTDDGAFTLDGGADQKRGSNKALHDGVLALYHEICIDLPRVKKWDDRRRRKLVARARELMADGKTNLGKWFRWYFEQVQGSDFLCGRAAGRDWRADLEWLLEPRNFVKVREGKYVNGAKSGRR